MIMQYSAANLGDDDFAMLKAYFDESGIHGGSPTCVVAGFVVSAKNGRNLIHDWQTELLYKHSVPYFHAKEFAQRTGPFRGWSDSDGHLTTAGPDAIPQGRSSG
jgi:hypothetical protein